MLKFFWQLAILFITPLVTYMICHAVWLSPVDKSLRIGLVAMAAVWGIDDFLDQIKKLVQ